MGQTLREKLNGIKTRCLNQSDPGFKFYGQRGIEVYKPWLKNTKLFIAYVSSLPNADTPGYSLDRINNNKGYIPGNLRFTTKTIQARNRRKRSDSVGKYIGVSIDRNYTSIRNWNARITINKKTIRIGRYYTEIDAAKARDEFIKLNKLDGFPLNFN